jgi:hypothetical protein
LHLKNKYNTDCKADDEAVSFNITGFLATASAGVLAIIIIASKAFRKAYRLIIIYDVAKFRQAFIIFIIICNIAFNIIEPLYF